MWFIPNGGPVGFLKDLASNWLLNNSLSSLSELTSQFIDFFGEFVNTLFVEIVRLNNSWVGEAATFTTLFSCSFITLLAMKQYLTVYVLETEGDPDGDPLDIILRAAEAIAFACSGTAIFNVFMNFSQAFVSDFLAGASPDSADVKLNLNLLHQSVKTSAGLILVIIIVVGLILFVITAGVRGAEMILMKILFPLFACDKVTTGRERWNQFFMSYATTWVSYGLQLFSFKMFCQALNQLAAGGDFMGISTDLIICLGWLVSMLRSPKWLQRFMYSSGVSGAANVAGRTAAGAARFMV